MKSQVKNLLCRILCSLGWKSFIKGQQKPKGKGIEFSSSNKEFVSKISCGIVFTSYTTTNYLFIWAYNLVTKNLFVCKWNKLRYFKLLRQNHLKKKEKEKYVSSGETELDSMMINWLPFVYWRDAKILQSVYHSDIFNDQVLRS